MKKVKVPEETYLRPQNGIEMLLKTVMLPRSMRLALHLSGAAVSREMTPKHCDVILNLQTVEI